MQTPNEKQSRKNGAADARSSSKRAKSRGVAGVSLIEEPAPVIDLREHQLFRSLDLENKQRVLRSDLEKVLSEVGLRRDDRRLAESMAALDAFEDSFEAPAENEIPRDRFFKAIRHNVLLIERALQGNMIIPDFADFSDEVEKIYKSTREVREGKVADYIPQLNLKGAEADSFGVALCTIDGQRTSFGEAQDFFTLQSVCKPVNYGIALEQHGVDAVHAFIGHEPSGVSFNELALDRRMRPHNPMINAGAIMSSALIGLKEQRAQRSKGEAADLDSRGWAGKRFDLVMERWRALCGGERPHFSTPVYLSERETADRNFALAYFMREKGTFPADVDLHEVLDFYFQCCSIEVTAEMLSVVAATLANSGICPVTGERVFSTETIRHTLSLMSSCGMYDFSGEFAFRIGLPAKSGVSGAIMIVVPNVMGICTWSPRLDENGNSNRGIAFCRKLVEKFNFHIYDNLTGVSGKRDPRQSRLQALATEVNEVIWAASKGDLGALRDQFGRGVKLGCADYDLRTALHLAAAEGQTKVVEFFVAQERAGDAAVDLNPRDRWGGRPLDDAYAHGHQDIVEILEAAGAVRGAQNPSTAAAGDISSQASPQAQSDKTAELIWAASLGDLSSIRRLVAQGVPLDIADYDRRSPLHLAAAEGHLEVVRYLIAQVGNSDPRDRWGNTPLDEAVRHDQAEVAELLRKRGCRASNVPASVESDEAPRLSA